MQMDLGLDEVKHWGEQFDRFWAGLLSALEPGLKIPNWTAIRGRMGDYMVIQKVLQSAIWVESPSAKHIQRVPQVDFYWVWELWDEYKTQRLRRSELSKETRYSKYIISIMHWYEEQVSPDSADSEKEGGNQLELWED